MLKATYLNRYKKVGDDGVLRTVFRYTLNGAKAELAKYKKILEDKGIPVHTDEESGKMIYFTITYHGKTCDVTITSNNKIVVEDIHMDALQSLMNQATDPAVKSALATQIANAMIAKITQGSTASAPVAQAEETPAEDAKL